MAEQPLHLAVHCGTGTVWTGTDLKSRDEIFAQAERMAAQDAQADHEADLARRDALRQADAAAARDAVVANQRRAAAFDKLAATHPEVAHLIKAILS